jgi:hypothetical protein
MKAAERGASRRIKHGETKLTEFTDRKSSTGVAARVRSQYGPTRSRVQWAASVPHTRTDHTHIDRLSAWPVGTGVVVNNRRTVCRQTDGRRACAPSDEYGTKFWTAAARRG